MVSQCLPSDALLQHLPSYLGFSYLGRGVSLHGCSSKTQLLLLTLDKGYLLTTALPDLQHGMAPLGPPESAQPPLLGRGVAPPGLRPWPWAWGCSSPPQPLASDAAPGLRCGVAPFGCCPWPPKQGSSSLPSPLTSDMGQLLSAALSALATATCTQIHTKIYMDLIWFSDQGHQTVILGT